MRVSARIIFVVLFFLAAVLFSHAPVYAQTANQSSAGITQSSPPSNYFNTNTYANVPQNHHTFTQVELIDILSAVMCQLTGIDPTNPNQSCLGVDTTTGKIGFAPTQTQQFGQATTQPQLGGAVGLMTQYISTLYVPAVSSTQYMQYLAANFGIVKPTYAAATTTDCNNSTFGYGFCGLSPIMTLWSDIRDLAYALLTILFIAIGIGVMLRFRVDPRTVMTLQNQIPRVIIAILLITFSFAIAGAMIDVMWTVTYAGVNFISGAAPNSKVAVNCPQAPTAISQSAETRLIDNPVSFTNTIFRADCNGGFDNGFVDLADKVSAALSDLVTQIVHDTLFANGSSCHVSFWQVVLVVPGLVKGAECALQNGALTVMLWIAEFLVKIIIVVTLLIALFRLWYQLIKCYLIFLIFVIMGPIWIVLGLIPGRPMGFEKWLRIIFANLAVFPLVAFLLVFARVITDLVPQGNNTPNSFFVPPLVGNPNLTTFADLMGFGAILLAPSVPDIIKERMKATGQAKYGATIAAGIGLGTAAATAPGRKVWESMNRRHPQTGAPEGPLAVRRQMITEKLPLIGRRSIVNRRAAEAWYRDPGKSMSQAKLEAQHAYWASSSQGNNPAKAAKYQAKLNARAQKQQARTNNGPAWRRFINRGRTRGEEPENSNS